MAKIKTMQATLTEGDVLAGVLEAAQMLGLDVDRQNTGGATLPGKGGKDQVVKFGRKGNTDVTGMVTRGPNKGAKLDVEVKREGFDPSKLGGEKKEHFDRQLARMQRTNENGGIGFWVDDAAEFLEIMKHVLAGAKVDEPGYGRPVVYYPEARTDGDQGGSDEATMVLVPRD